MTAYYNEFDPGAAAWLRELIRAGLIADGVVDERSILDVEPADLAGFTQCHFFAGIGGWSYALRLAGWPDDRPVWTGSPPCQPFSAAGARKGKEDERHLAPHFIDLVRACRPGVLFGEQVASADVFGKAAKGSGKGAATQPGWAWLDDLQDRLEAARYAVGAADIPAASVGAPHIRQRTFFGAVRLADTDSGSKGMVRECRNGVGEWKAGDTRFGHWRRGSNDGTADADHARSQGRRGVPECADECASGPGSLEGGLADAETSGRREEYPVLGWSDGGDRTEGRAAGHDAGGATVRPDAPDSPWGTADWLFCRDGKWRPVEPGTFPLAHGLPARVGRLRGYGNAIVPQAAAEFIQAFEAARADGLRLMSGMTTNKGVFG